MPSYHFVLCNSAGDNEDLGYVALTNDDEAIDFGATQFG
jgi:hypothetical protein